MDSESPNGNPVTSPDPVAQPGDAVATAEAPSTANQLQLHFRERFESLLPTIQKEWPDVARHTLEATRGSFDQVVEAISHQTGHATDAVKGQLLDLLHVTTDKAQQLGDSLQPLEEQLERLLDELNGTLRPKITKPVRERPLVSIGIAAGVGLLVGLLLRSGRRSA
jgi:ElaB/YqjD/DUF883 family membrane-anchored ribosome-binding protein